VAVLRGEIRPYLPGVSRRDKGTVISGEKVLIISNDGANRSMPTALTLPVHESIDSELPPAAYSLIVAFGDLDPIPGGAVNVYWPKVIPIVWFGEPVGMLSQATMRQVFAAIVEYIGD
jgi:mRNA-degrading endonuclease toxin of MazEF toxin-antitoxin module